MPIREENRHRYPANWREISRRVRVDRAGNRCECAGLCGSPRCIAVITGRRCTAVHLKPHPVTGSKVILTTAHLDHTPENCADTNLAAWCQLCHLAYDRHLHEANRRRTRLTRQHAGMDSLFGGEQP